MRCGTPPAPNYGEAQAAESRADFVHKLKVVLKELRETKVWLLIILRAGILKSSDLLELLMGETEELISIVFKSIETAKNNMKIKKS